MIVRGAWFRITRGQRYHFFPERELPDDPLPGSICGFHGAGRRYVKSARSVRQVNPSVICGRCRDAIRRLEQD